MRVVIERERHAIAVRALRRVRAEHTAEHRAAQLEHDAREPRDAARTRAIPTCESMPIARFA